MEPKRLREQRPPASTNTSRLGQNAPHPTDLDRQKRVRETELPLPSGVRHSAAKSTFCRVDRPATVSAALSLLRKRSSLARLRFGPGRLTQLARSTSLAEGR